MTLRRPHQLARTTALLSCGLAVACASSAHHGSDGAADVPAGDARVGEPGADAATPLADTAADAPVGAFDSYTTGVDAVAARRPNILVILADDLGYGDLSSYGARDLASPAIDRLAAEGMRFTGFYANSSVCSPTRAALLTGRFPDLVGVPGVIRQVEGDTFGNLADDATVLAEPLAKAGYHTAIIGKWHLGFDPPDTPLDRGFAHFHGFLADMMDDYYTHTRGGINWMRLDRDTITPEGHATDLFTQWAIDYLAERKQHPEPFFLYLAYNAPHSPLQPPAEWLARVQTQGTSGDRAALVALIEHMDDGIGKVLQALADNGQRDDTLVIFASDNGGDLGASANNSPLRGGKMSMWEGGVRVPAVVSWPGHIAGGATSSAPFMTMDIFATALEAAGIGDTDPVESRSFLPVLLGQATDAPARTIFFVRRELPGDVHYGARSGDYKLVQNTPGGPFMLYNLRDDLGETTDLADVEPNKLHELEALLDQHRQVAEAVPWL